MKTKLMIALISVVVLASCEKKQTLPAIDSIYGKYNGTLSIPGNSLAAFCDVTKINDNQVIIYIGEQNQAPSMVTDTISVTASESNYSLSQPGGFSGTVNGTNLTWSDPYYSFTGTK